MKLLLSFFLILMSYGVFSYGNKDIGYQIPYGSTVRINEQGICKQVQNSHASRNYFVSVKTSPEWSSFINFPPLGTSFSNCDAIYRSCLDYKKANPAATSGKYTIDPDGVGTGMAPIDTYCDMTTDGGGWTLVWSNTRTGTNKPSRNMLWTEATQTLPRCSQAQGSGTGCENFLGNDKEAFNYYIGIDWWSRITGQKKNSEFMYQWSSNFGQPIEQMSKFNIQRSNDSKLFVITANNISLLTGSLMPGLYSFHFGNKLPLSTKDKELGNCVSGFDGAPFWYSGCWNGSIIGGSEISHLGYFNGAYYHSSSASWGSPSGSGAGNGWFFVREYEYLANCTEVKSKFPLSPSGKYWIDPDGSGGNAPFHAQCDMTSDGGGWTLVMNQNLTTGGYFTDATHATLNDINNPDSGRYSVLSYLESFRSLQGNFTFKINWPGYSQRNIWRQRSNPAVDQPVAGYVPISIDASSNYWGGLERNCTVNCTSSFIDGSVGQNDRWYSTGTFTPWAGGIPAFSAIGGVNHSQLWVRDDSFLLRTPRDCQEILEYGKSTGNGLYWIDPTSSGISMQVYCDMTSDGGGWTLVFNHNVAGGYFTNAADVPSKNPGTPTANLYSILDRLEDFKANDRHILKINWPGYNERNIWVQKTNPTTDQPVGGYAPISIDSDTYNWGGLERNCSVSCVSSYIDGAINHSNYFYAIGTYAVYGVTTFGVPASGSIVNSNDGVPHVQLWTRRSEGHYTKRSCKEILDAGLSTGDGLYHIDPDGVGGELPFKVYCDMTTSGGGWTRVAFTNGTVTAATVPNDFMVMTHNKHFIGRTDITNNASSINSEWFSKVIGTSDAMLKASVYTGSPFIDVGMGEWNYDTPRCSGTLLHTSRTAGCAGQGANDTYNANDRFNIAFSGGASAIVPTHNNMGSELCYSGKGDCTFEFYLR